MHEHKSTRGGKEQRRDLLRVHFADLDEQPACVSPGLLIDAVDAHALAWSANRLASGTATNIPLVAELDARGLRAEMIA